MNLLSWGNYPNRKQTSIALDPSDLSKWKNERSRVLARGLGRSYGDSCLNSEGKLLTTSSLNKFISFDEKSGLLTVESGVTFEEILKVFVPKGWFLPVTPGTKYVTVGGAIANDVHGKNHHTKGTFGNCIVKMGLIQSVGEEFVLSPLENKELFSATIGGLGLTGIIAWASFHLIKIKSAYLETESVVFNSLDQFLKLSKLSDKTHEYSVAWVDCLSGKELRGIFFRGNHSNVGDLKVHQIPKLNIPFYFPKFALSYITVRLFNFLYFNIKKLNSKGYQHYDSFFYPLDSILNWNRIYGANGFVQYQFVVPKNENGIRALKLIISKIKESESGSFLSVLKSFGDLKPIGMLSFPFEGITLALDFPANNKVFKLLYDCDKILLENGGRVYPAKDSQITSDFFWQTNKKISQFNLNRDARFSSDFSKRVHL